MTKNLASGTLLVDSTNLTERINAIRKIVTFTASSNITK
jgi:hypothetical protein